MKDLTGIHVVAQFLDKIEAQDNRGTQTPIFFVIRDADWKLSDEGCGDDGDGKAKSEKTIFVNVDDTECCYESEEELKKYLEEDFATGAEIDEEIKENYEERRLILVWREYGMFLTETEADAYLKRVRGNFSEAAHTYVKSASGARELIDFFSAITGMIEEVIELNDETIKHLKDSVAARKETVKILEVCNKIQAENNRLKVADIFENVDMEAIQASIEYNASDADPDALYIKVEYAMNIIKDIQKGRFKQKKTDDRSKILIHSGNSSDDSGGDLKSKGDFKGLSFGFDGAYPKMDFKEGDKNGETKEQG
jgi:hypothetical protein